jgi:hypothetical protein
MITWFKALSLFVWSFWFSVPAAQATWHGHGKPCYCVGLPETKRYMVDNLNDPNNTNWSFRCDYICFDKDNNRVEIKGAVHARKSRGEPSESKLRCGGVYYKAEDNPYNISEPRYIPTSYLSHVNGSWSEWTSAIDADKVQEWAKEAGCR